MTTPRPVPTALPNESERHYRTARQRAQAPRVTGALSHRLNLGFVCPTTLPITGSLCSDDVRRAQGGGGFRFGRDYRHGASGCHQLRVVEEALIG